MTRASPASLYDEDFYAWTQDQAAALRAMPLEAFGDDIDIAHLAEEIEDLGKRDLREVRSYFARIFEHLVKIKGAPNSQDVPHWRSEIRFFHESAAEVYSARMRRLLDLESAWQKGCRRGQTFLSEIGVDALTPRSCPFALDDMLINKFDVDAALRRLGETDDSSPRRDVP